MVVDNEGVLGDLWYRTGAIALCVRPTSNTNLESGLYISYRGATEASTIKLSGTLQDIQTGKTPIRFWPSKAAALAEMEAAELQYSTAKIKLATEQTKAEQSHAKLKDDEVGSLREALAEAQAAMSRLQQQQIDEMNRLYSVTQQEHAARLAEAQARSADEFKRFQAALEERDKDRERRRKEDDERRKAADEEQERRRKEYYEEQSYERKNYNEMLKMIPSLLSIALSILVLIKSAKAK